ncbi:MAG: hypothetical protein E6G56_11310 [Actinobacteria bacterium]|nr:MAG: hypothetical protein E6G56_11310 [Actinomycetota bacterium]
MNSTAAPPASVPAPAEPGPGGLRRFWRPGRRLHAVEGIVLIVVGLLLGAAVIRDVARHVGIEKRAIVDRHTFRAYVHRPKLKKIAIAPPKRGTVDKVCGQSASGAHQRLCLFMGGPAHVRLRQVRGGYYLPLLKPDRYRFRWGCFGSALAHHLCGAPAGRP